jgi:GxxExxY protein
VEFEDQNLSYSQQMSYPIYYKNHKVDEFIPDLIIENKVIAEAKTVESIIDEHRGQLINYLRISGIKVGLIINFKHSELQWERIVLEKAR